MDEHGLWWVCFQHHSRFESRFKYEATEEDDIVMRRKVIRGGSWKDVGYLIQTGTRSFEYQDSTKSYVGFRCVMDFLGRDLRDF